MPHTIDNPGGGDCAFYAFAIGLIAEIQKQVKETGQSPLFDKWVAQGLKGVTLDNIKEFELTEESHSHAKRPLLDTLQLSLRHISAEETKQDLLKQAQREDATADFMTLVEGTSIFHQFMELVKESAKDNPDYATLSKFNELALSSEAQKLALETAKLVGREIVKQNPQSEQERDKIENIVVKGQLIRDIYDGQSFKDTSVIIEAVDAVKMPGHWGTHSNLKEVAQAIGVNLKVTGQTDGVMIPTQPTIQLNNIGNAHWTTEVQGTAPAKTSTRSKSSYHSMVKSFDVMPERASFIEEHAHTVRSEHQDSYKQELNDLLDKEDDIHKKAEAAIKKEEAGESLSDEELAYKLQDEEFRNASFKR